MEKFSELKDKNILVTGGAGFIGSNIVERLLSIGCRSVRVLDNLSTGKMSNIQDQLDMYPGQLEFQHGDISDLEVCRRAVSGIDIVCHQAALGSVPRSIENPLASHKSNVDGIFNMLLACKELGIKRFVYASSSSVYGDDPNLPKTEDCIGRQLSPYAVTKHIDELYSRIFTHTYGMECIGLRYFNVFGPKQDPNGAYAAVIPKFILTLLRGGKVTINGDGSYSRDFTYIDNVVQANLLGLSTSNPDCFGEVFNIGLNSKITIEELYRAIGATIGITKDPIYGNVRKGDIPHSNASIDKAKKFLNYYPQTSFEDGLERTVNWFKNH